ncbi:hypothetical protein Tco_1345242 [Tanacetum coccineum]
MSADSIVTYTSVHSEARSWSIPSEDPYEEAAQQLLEQVPCSPEYVHDPIELEDHVPVYILEPEHPEDLVPAEDEAPTPPLPPFFLSPHFFYSYDVYSLKRGRKDKDKDEDPSAGSDRGLKKRKTSKDNTTLKNAIRLFQKNLDWEIPKGDDYPFDLSKPLPLIRVEIVQRVPVRIFNNNDLKYLQGRISTMDIYDYALWGFSTLEDKHKSFYAFARGMQSRGDVYSTKRILAVTHVSVMRKHGYGYLEEIVVRRAENAFYRFKEGDFPRLRINDIEDMLLLCGLYNRPHKISGDDVGCLAWLKEVHQKVWVIRCESEDLQLGVKLSNEDQHHKLDTTSRSQKKYKQGTHTLHTKTLKDSFMSTTTRGTEHAEFGESDTYVLERFATPAGNPVKKITLKLNLSNHRSILTDSKEYLKMVMEVPDSSRLTRFIATCSYPTDKYKDIMKAQVHVSRLPLI